MKKPPRQRQPKRRRATRGRRATKRIRPSEIFKRQYVSFTRIRTFHVCPRRFELIYLYGVREKASRAADLGTLVHSVLQLYTQRHKDDLSRALQSRQAVANVLRFYDEACRLTRPAHSITKSELRPYVAHFVAMNKETKAPIEMIERELVVTVDGYKIRCIIDRVDAGRVLIDYKTGKPDAPPHQLNLYAYALSNGTWKPQRLELQFLRTGDRRSWRYTKKLHGTTKDWLFENIREIEKTTVFERNRSGLCRYCGVARYCYRDP